MSSIAGTYNIIADQGATFSRAVIKKDSRKRVIPLTDYTARMQVRVSVDSSSAILNMTTENGYITIDEPKGSVFFGVSADEMSGIPAGKYVYDLELVSPIGVVERLIMGSFTVRAEVTR